MSTTTAQISLSLYIAVTLIPALFSRKTMVPKGLYSLLCITARGYDMFTFRMTWCNSFEEHGTEDKDE